MFSLWTFQQQLGTCLTSCKRQVLGSTTKFLTWTPLRFVCTSSMMVSAIWNWVNINIVSNVWFILKLAFPVTEQIIDNMIRQKIVKMKIRSSHFGNERKNNRYIVVLSVLMKVMFCVKWDDEANWCMGVVVCEWAHDINTRTKTWTLSFNWNCSIIIIQIFKTCWKLDVYPTFNYFLTVPY